MKYIATIILLLLTSFKMALASQAVNVGYSISFSELTPEFPYGKDNCTVSFFVNGAKSPLKVTVLCYEIPRVYIVGASPSRAIFLVVSDNHNRMLATAYKIVKGKLSVIWEDLSRADIVVTSPKIGTLKVEFWQKDEEAEHDHNDYSLHRYIHTIKFP
jgi:hypothetical protein